MELRRLGSYISESSCMSARSAVALHPQSFIELAGIRAFAETGSTLAATRIRGQGYSGPGSQRGIVLATVHNDRCHFMAGMRGNVTRGLLPRKEFRSLPHSPTMRTLSKSVSSEATGSAIDSTTASPDFLITRAFIL